LYFVYQVYQQHKDQDNPVKRSLYLRLGFLFGPWFLGLPLLVLLSHVLEDWTRARVIESISLVISTLAYFAMTWLLWHSRAEEYFSIEPPDFQANALNVYAEL